MESEKIVNVIGAGLAGVEAAYQLAKNNHHLLNLFVLIR